MHSAPHWETDCSLTPAPVTETEYLLGIKAPKIDDGQTEIQASGTYSMHHTGVKTWNQKHLQTLVSGPKSHR